MSLYCHQQWSKLIQYIQKLSIISGFIARTAHVMVVDNCIAVTSLPAVHAIFSKSVDLIKFAINKMI